MAKEKPKNTALLEELVAEHRPDEKFAGKANKFLTTTNTQEFSFDMQNAEFKDATGKKWRGTDHFFHEAYIENLAKADAHWKNIEEKDSAKREAAVAGILETYLIRGADSSTHAQKAIRQYLVEAKHGNYTPAARIQHIQQLAQEYLGADEKAVKEVIKALSGKNKRAAIIGLKKFGAHVGEAYIGQHKQWELNNILGTDPNARHALKSHLAQKLRTDFNEVVKAELYGRVPAEELLAIYEEHRSGSDPKTKARKKEVSITEPADGTYQKAA